MIRVLAVASFVLAVASSAEAMTGTPIAPPDGLRTPVAYACGAGRIRVNDVCVARTTVRQARRCVHWHGGVCAVWR
jgi:hypothetical protein